MNNFMKILILPFTIQGKFLLNKLPFLLGPYNLRITNDQKIKTGLFTQLILNKNDEIKFKTTLSNGIFAYKTSRSGIITNWKINNDNCIIIKNKLTNNQINIANENN